MPNSDVYQMSNWGLFKWKLKRWWFRNYTKESEAYWKYIIEFAEKREQIQRLRDEVRNTDQSEGKS